uniref:zinc transporter ZIP11-like isoform X3 n=1 Tax=Gasterosteus aculeatus aculeatus TaxID=481459 RepID=UPI001A998B2B|nr:zinc transporter ZIP11-like isoform X3 [Gasterosteus aculeatus aculeatus]
MLEGYSPVTQALLGTLFTWALTAAGAALVFVFSSRQKRILDGSLGFAAGGVGADPHIALALPPQSKLPKEKADEPSFHLLDSDEMTIRIGRAAPLSDKMDNGDVYQRRRGPQSAGSDGQETGSKQQEGVGQATSSWRRIVLLILAITIHNIPEGLAVGVGFGAIGKTSSATFESARNLAIGIGIQNFPEGLAVSLPLRGAGMSTWRAFWYGQLSGMVEPIAGLLGAAAVVLAEPLLPYALAFAAGAMVYVVVDDIIPEAQLSGNGKLASWTSILGFVVMMSLDVGLG